MGLALGGVAILIIVALVATASTANASPAQLPAPTEPLPRPVYQPLTAAAITPTAAAPKPAAPAPAAKPKAKAPPKPTQKQIDAVDFSMNGARMLNTTEYWTTAYKMAKEANYTAAMIEAKAAILKLDPSLTTVFTNPTSDTGIGRDVAATHKVWDLVNANPDFNRAWSAYVKARDAGDTATADFYWRQCAQIRAAHDSDFGDLWLAYVKARDAGDTSTAAYYWRQCVRSLEEMRKTDEKDLASRDPSLADGVGGLMSWLFGPAIQDAAVQAQRLTIQVLATQEMVKAQTAAIQMGTPGLNSDALLQRWQGFINQWAAFCNQQVQGRFSWWQIPEKLTATLSQAFRGPATLNAVRTYTQLYQGLNQEITQAIRTAIRLGERAAIGFDLSFLSTIAQQAIKVATTNPKSPEAWLTAARAALTAGKSQTQAVCQQQYLANGGDPAAFTAPPTTDAQAAAIQQAMAPSAVGGHHDEDAPQDLANVTNIDVELV
jgi:hypothetical protein